MEGIPGAPQGSTGSLIDRAKAIVMSPRTEWPRIAAETASSGEIFTRYAIPLLAIGPLAALIGGQLFGYGAFGVSYKPSLMAGLTTAVVSLVMGVVSLVAITFIADFLAPKFGGTAHRPAAFKLVAYSMTAAWLAGVFGLLPMLGILGLLGLYSLFLFYLGATTLMKVPENQAAGYTAVTVICGIVLSLLLGLVTAPLVALAGGGAALSQMSSSGGEASGELTIPGVGKVDVGKIEEASKQAEAMANGEIKPVDTEKLKGLLPASLGAYGRTAIDTGAVGSFGKGVSGTYTSGDKTITLRVMDSAGLGALAGLAGAMGAEQSHEDANGYERTSTANGAMQTEKWDNAGRRGEFGRQVGTRFFISAEGQAGSIDELKAAVASIDQNALTGLAN